ncbi:predicted protein [Naegleria gruberi]|uniref:Predicted protein n=1 Tax=Naegleria gruberi TaxID=5762 RepID=D2V8E3_NAEGR|nr:uncharacterized protein NAEGRDRAFT_47497 [Naegleria gruberi]EFC47029.1 predicted protein [Naegleria gruberi]|eukprot:XP_002679773.1 predicted protein [Naegleria gruberi strain NEG-M]
MSKDDRHISGFNNTITYQQDAGTTDATTNRIALTEQSSLLHHQENNNLNNNRDDDEENHTLEGFENSNHIEDDNENYLNNYFTQSISKHYRKTLYSQCFALILNRRIENVASFMCSIVLAVALAMIASTLSATHTMIEDADCTAALQVKEMCKVWSSELNCTRYDGQELRIGGYVFDESSLFYANVNRSKSMGRWYQRNSIALACPVLCSSDNVTWSYKDCENVENQTLIDNVCLKFDSVFCSANMLVEETIFSVFAKLKDSSFDVWLSFAPLQSPIVILLLKAFMSIPSSIFKIDHMLYILVPFFMSWIAVKARILAILGVYNVAEEAVPFIFSIILQLLSDIIFPFFGAFFETIGHMLGKLGSKIAQSCKPPKEDDCCYCCVNCPPCPTCHFGLIEYFNTDISIADYIFPDRKGRYYTMFSIWFGTHKENEIPTSKDYGYIGGWRIFIGIVIVMVCILAMTIIVIINNFFPILSHERIMIVYFFLFYSVLHHSYGFISVILYLIHMKRGKNMYIRVVFLLVRVIGLFLIIGTMFHFAFIEFFPYTW